MFCSHGHWNVHFAGKSQPPKFRLFYLKSEWLLKSSLNENLKSIHREWLNSRSMDANYNL